MISRSTNSRSSARASTSVTAIPIAASMEAYSSPITPPPMTTSAGEGAFGGLPDLVGVADAEVLEDVLPARAACRGDEDAVRLQPPQGPLVPLHLERVRIDEAPGPRRSRCRSMDLVARTSRRRATTWSTRRRRSSMRIWCLTA
jgi:hypothetical protein